MANYIYNLFTKKQVQELMYEGILYDKDEENEDTEDILYEVVQEKLYSSDQEKNSTTYEYIIKENFSNKFYKTYWSKSPWIGQEEYNAYEAFLVEVFPKEVVTVKTIYSEIP